MIQECQTFNLCTSRSSMRPCEEKYMLWIFPFFRSKLKLRWRGPDCGSKHIEREKITRSIKHILPFLTWGVGLGEILEKMKICTWNSCSNVIGSKIQF